METAAETLHEAALVALKDSRKHPDAVAKAIGYGSKW